MTAQSYELQFEYSPRKLPGGTKPDGTRSVSLLVREDVYFHAKTQAAASGLRFPEFVARVLAECHPISPEVRRKESGSDRAFPVPPLNGSNGNSDNGFECSDRPTGSPVTDVPIAPTNEDSYDVSD